MDKIDKFLRKISDEVRCEILKILKLIKDNKTSGLDIKKLKGEDGIFRARKGKIRIIYSSSGEKISILAVERRSDNTYNL